MAQNVIRAQPRRTVSALSAERFLNTTSPIAKPDKNLIAFFQTCIGLWDAFYDEEEKQKIIDTLPPSYRKYETGVDGKLICPITPDFVMTDQIYRENIAKFQRDVSDGFWTATWRTNAKKAAKERAQGKFDEFLMQHAEEMFGDGTPDSNTENDDAEKSDRDYGENKSQRGAKGRIVEKRKNKSLKGQRRKMIGEIDHLDEV